MQYFSQIGQDRYYIESIIGGRRGGRFLDVGAHNGIDTSNTYALETQLGWTGVCVEANPELAHQCRQNRPGSQVIEAAAWSSEARLAFEMPGSGNMFLSRISGIEHNRHYFADDFQQSHTIAVDAKPLRALLGDGDHWFDYFSLDVEGAELEVLHGIDWQHTRFGYIALEFGRRPGFLDQIRTFLEGVGYQLARVNDFDADFTPVAA